MAFVPASLRAHPVGSVLDVPVLARLLKSCVYADPNVVRLMHVDAAVLLVSELTLTAMAKVTNTLSPMNDPSRRFPADSPNATEMLIRSSLSFAKHETEFVNSEGKPEGKGE